MDEAFKNILIRVIFLPAGVVIAYIILYLRGFSHKEYFGLKIPSKKDAIFWLLWFIPLFILTEIWYFGLGLHVDRVWQYTLPVAIVRAIGVILLAPVSEELIFRGVMFKAIADRRTGPAGAVIITTIIFTAMHYQYDFPDLVPIFIDAFYWGWVRYRTNSTILPIVMHIFANAVAVNEFIWINKLFSQ